MQSLYVSDDDYSPLKKAIAIVFPNSAESMSYFESRSVCSVMPCDPYVQVKKCVVMNKDLVEAQRIADCVLNFDSVDYAEQDDKMYEVESVCVAIIKVSKGPYAYWPLADLQIKTGFDAKKFEKTLYGSSERQLRTDLVSIGTGGAVTHFAIQPDMIKFLQRGSTYSVREQWQVHLQETGSVGVEIDYACVQEEWFKLVPPSIR
jgi:hypothetical protein